MASADNIVRLIRAIMLHSDYSDTSVLMKLTREVWMDDAVLDLRVEAPSLVAAARSGATYRLDRLLHDTKGRLRSGAERALGSEVAGRSILYHGALHGSPAITRALLSAHEWSQGVIEDALRAALRAHASLETIRQLADTCSLGPGESDDDDDDEAYGDLGVLAYAMDQFAPREEASFFLACCCAPKVAQATRAKRWRDRFYSDEDLFYDVEHVPPATEGSPAVDLLGFLLERCGRPTIAERIRMTQEAATWSAPLISALYERGLAYVPGNGEDGAQPADEPLLKGVKCPLAAAAGAGHTDGVRALLTHGCNPWGFGAGCLAAAALHKQPKSVRLLLAALIGRLHSQFSEDHQQQLDFTVGAALVHACACSSTGLIFSPIRFLNDFHGPGPELTGGLNGYSAAAREILDALLAVFGLCVSTDNIRRSLAFASQWLPSEVPRLLALLKVGPGGLTREESALACGRTKRDKPLRPLVCAAQVHCLRSVRAILQAMQESVVADEDSEGSAGDSEGSASEAKSDAYDVANIGNDDDAEEDCGKEDGGGEAAYGSSRLTARQLQTAATSALVAMCILPYAEERLDGEDSEEEQDSDGEDDYFMSDPHGGVGAATLTLTAAAPDLPMRGRAAPDSVEIARLLLDAGADPNGRWDAYDRFSTQLVALIEAASWCPSLVVLLLERGANVVAAAPYGKGCVGELALKQAAKYGQVEAVRTLLAHARKLGCGDGTSMAERFAAHAYRRLMDDGVGAADCVQALSLLVSESRVQPTTRDVGQVLRWGLGAPAVEALLASGSASAWLAQEGPAVLERAASEGVPGAVQAVMRCLGCDSSAAPHGTLHVFRGALSCALVAACTPPGGAYYGIGKGGMPKRAAHANAEAIARMLLDAGADVNHMVNGRTPLSLAAIWSGPLTTFLLTAGSSGSHLDMGKVCPDGLRALLGHCRRPDGTYACVLPTEALIKGHRDPLARSILRIARENEAAAMRALAAVA